MLSVNNLAPKFSAVDSHGNIVNIGGASEYLTLIYFYPKDDTSSCTIQANDFTSLKSEFEKSGVHVYGISKDDQESHLKFIDKYNLSVGLLTDKDGTICDLYGTWGEKEKNGIKKIGIIRSTFVIDRAGLLRYVEYKVKAPSHAKMMLEFVNKLD